MTYHYPEIQISQLTGTGSDETLRAVLRRVYLWMTLGLFITAGIAAFVSVSPLFQVLAGQPWLFFILLIAELGLVMGISWGINRISSSTAMALFMTYAVLNGLTLSALFVAYSLGSITYAFLASAALFGVMSIIGYSTKIDLTKTGTFLLMGVLGLFIAMLINMFLANSILGWIITFVGIILFLGLTIYDTQRIKRMTYAAHQQGNENIESRLGILGALSLYLDFINLFLFVLRLGGRRR
jgi:FtsH-binding integral membrane protein